MEKEIGIAPEEGLLSNAGISVQGIIIDVDPDLVFIKNPDRLKKEEIKINLSGAGGSIYPV